MRQYIDKAIVVAQANIEITNLRIAQEEGFLTEYGKGMLEGLEGIVDFINTLEVKEVSEYNDVDMNPIFEEIGVDPDSYTAHWFRDILYEGMDKYLEKKRNKK